jgi:hypothetical protein
MHILESDSDSITIRSYCDRINDVVGKVLVILCYYGLGNCHHDVLHKIQSNERQSHTSTHTLVINKCNIYWHVLASRAQSHRANVVR